MKDKRLWGLVWRISLVVILIIANICVWSVYLNRHINYVDYEDHKNNTRTLTNDEDIATVKTYKDECEDDKIMVLTELLNTSELMVEVREHKCEGQGYRSYARSYYIRNQKEFINFLFDEDVLLKLYVNNETEEFKDCVATCENYNKGEGWKPYTINITEIRTYCNNKCKNGVQIE